ncbi:Spaetzle [Popillia japonica]|uniref:Spaetzle n=1 Tax=Popillia japonica TaxID=7064 RepID=A0AAW1J1B0_POPJA
MNHQVLYFIFGILLFGAIQAARIDNSNRGGPLKTQYKRQIDGGCFYNMCNHTDDYPEDEIRQLLEKTPSYKELFGTVTAPHRQISVTNRNGEEEERNMCGTKVYVTTPRKARDVHDVWQYVVNGEGMEQWIEYETCEEDASCDVEVQVPGHSVTCRVQEIVIRLLAFTKFKCLDTPLPAGYKKL